MRTIGLLGGMSWESSALYYRWINEGIKRRLGGLHSAKIAMLSVDFEEIETLQRQADWSQAAIRLARAAQDIQAAGADFLLICTNTMHIVADQIQAAIDIPILHLADATAERIVADQIDRVGLLGTRFTMQESFYKDRLRDRFGLDVIVPNEAEREIIHRVIYDELCLGKINDSSRKEYLKIIDHLRAQGAQCVIEGCTEITLLVDQRHTEVPLYDTTAIHAAAAVERALRD